MSMLNRFPGNKFDQKINLNLNSKIGSRLNTGFFNFLFQRLKKREQKEQKERFIFLITTISVLVISGIIISF